MSAIEDERAYAARCRARMREMVDEARRNVAVGEAVAGDPYSAEQMGRYLKNRAKELGDDTGGPPFFGRLDFGAGEHRGRAYHVGKRHLPDGSGPPLVIDWRAPVARAFYQAGARDPLGVALRRRFGWVAGALTGFEDERLGDGEEGGGGLLASEISRPRVGPMRDIVATIQPDQDDLVRAGVEESICVQGAPGTGKTAVGLHRAAYLLYSDRRRVERGGVLVLGPNDTFLRFIAEVLPTLGETGVEQATLEALLAPGPPRATDDPAAAAVKHDARMAGVLRRALYRRIARPEEPVVVPDGSVRWRVPAEELRRIVDDARRSVPRYDVGRERVSAAIVERVRRQAERRGKIITAAWLKRVARAVRPFLDAVWPRASPEDVLYDVLREPDDDRLTADERALIRWPRPPRTHKSARWTAADHVLLDELAGLLRRPRGYGHVIVDEAQDLSPMQCRAVARRSAFGSITVLGDLAQGTTPWAARAWDDRLAALGKPQARVVPLTTGYRVPAGVTDLANRLLARMDLAVAPARSFRTDGRVRVTRAGDLVADAVEAVRAALADEGSIGVIAAGPTAETIGAALAGAGPTGDGRVTVLPATAVKGLEFDHVVLAEPAEIAAGPRGANRLYVAVTRAVTRLDVLYTAECAPLTD